MNNGTLAYNYFEGELRPGKAWSISGIGEQTARGCGAKIAGLLHCAEHGRAAYETPVSVNTVDAAARLGIVLPGARSGGLCMMAQMSE